MDQKLRNYFEDVIALEKESYVQVQLLDRMIKKINRLGISESISRTEIRYPTSFFECALGPSYWSVIIFAGWFGIKGLFESFISGAIGGIFSGGLLGLGIGLVIGGIKFAIKRAEEMEQQEGYDMQYYAKVSADQNRVEEENKIKIRLQGQWDALLEQHQKTLAVLDKYYAIGVIHKDYRDMNGVCSLYDFFDKGICTQFTGPHGANYLYEQKLRDGKFEKKLDIIIDHVEAIRNFQPMLYSAITEGNQATSRLLNEVERQTMLQSYTLENSRIALYNQECQLAEQRYANSIQTYRLLSGK